MPRTIAGKSLHPVGLGCMNVSWAYGTPPSHDECVKLLRQAVDLGYDHFDTARIYGAGQNEALLAGNRPGHSRVVPFFGFDAP